MSIEQIKVKALATEFEMTETAVITELKKIGVWVPSPDTEVDNDIANRIRKRLQVLIEADQEEAEKKAEKKKRRSTAKTRRSIKELGKPRKKGARKAESPDQELETPFLSTASKPRKGKRSTYRKVEIEEELPQKVEISIEDEPLIQRVEAEASAELIERQQESAEELEALTRQLQAAEEMRAQRAVQEEAEAAAKAAVEAAAAEKAALAAEAAAAAGEAPEADQAEGAADVKEEEVETGPREVVFSEKVTVKLLSEKTGVRSNQIIAQLMRQGVMAGINQVLDQEVVEALCEHFEIIPEFVSFEEEAVLEQQLEAEQPDDLTPRAPVVTVMGHVDHGKTSLLDTIRNTRVTAGEAGGITQHIGAYEARVGKNKIVFIDTPGHKAFTRMRARGAQATDIVVLVVAADDGVMPQTVEAIDHARAADVPIIVAVNKIDKANAQPDRVKQGLSEHKLVPEDWGGDTVFVEVSATEGTNVDQLLEMILLVAEVQELKANPDRPGSGVVLEARLEKGRGNVATVVVQNGTMRVGDIFIAGSAYGKVRAMFDEKGKPRKEAGPSSAIELLGLQSLPEAGDPLQVVDNMARAREIVEFRQEKLRQAGLAGSARVSLDDLYAQMAAGDVKDLLVVLKADTRGSAEVLEDTLNGLSTAKVQVRVIRKAVGAISEDDVLLASTSRAIVIGFNVRPEASARSAAEKEEVDVRLYSVIYEVADEIQNAMLGLLDPVFEEQQLGRAEVRETFRVPKFGVIAGCYVVEGTIARSAEVRLLRDHVVVYEGGVDSLRRFKDDTNEVRSGYECGISITNFNDIKIGDEIEAYVKKEVAPKLT